VHPDVFLNTERMVLRRFTKQDVDHLLELDSDPDVMMYLTGGVPHTRDDIVERVLPHYLEYYDHYDSFGFWAAVEKDSDTFIGWFHLRAFRTNPKETELGYRLKKAFWNCGLATEGSIALIKYGFEELGVRKVVATTMAKNARSRRVMEKLGMRFECEFTYPGDPFPGWTVEECTEVKYGITRHEWMEIRQQS
jgi:RimJ/RimL family protein N-acetyltransferase